MRVVTAPANGAVSALCALSDGHHDGLAEVADAELCAVR
jgi:hypothetical protein